jgi:hypothetical protein
VSSPADLNQVSFSLLIACVLRAYMYMYRACVHMPLVAHVCIHPHNGFW